MAELPILVRPYIAPKFFPSSDMDFTDVPSSKNLVNWAQKNGIMAMNFKSIFCDTKICNRYSSNGWLYRNASHLSITGAQLAIPTIISYLDKY